MAELLNPTNDYVFKRLFSDSPDVLAKDEQGGQYNIEIQVYRFHNWYQRSLYYLSRMMATQLKSGIDYNRVGANVGVHLLDFDLFTTTDSERAQASWCFEMRDATQPQVSMGNLLQLNLLELAKASRLRAAEGALRNWISFFKQWREDWEMSNIEHKPVLAAMERLRALSQDEEERWRALSRERALLDEATLLTEAREAGILAGKAEGKAESKAEILTQQLTIKFGALPESITMQIAQATDADLSHWLKQVLFAEQLEDVMNGR
jgi:predicted transposase/invertase (TIGR01784 family)